MTVKDPVKNQEYVAKHRKHMQEEVWEAEYKRREAEARRLRGQMQKQTLPPLNMETLHKFRPMDINNLISFDMQA